MPIGSTSSCTDSVSLRSCSLDCTLAFCGTLVWRMCVVRTRVALAFAWLCMQSMSRAHVEMKHKARKIVHFIFVAPMDSHVTNEIVYNVNLHITIFSRVYSHVTHMHSCVLVCNRK